MRALIFALLLLCTAPWALADEWSRLMELSQEQGSVRVIVQMDEPALPAGLLTAQQRAGQQARIQEVQQRVLERLAAAGRPATPSRRFSRVPGMVLRADQATLQALRDDPEVRAITEDHLHRPLLGDSIPLIQANTLWAQGGTGSGWAVAILDTGVDKTHAFFEERVVAEACFSSNDENENATSLCPDGEETSYADGAGMDCSDISGCGHGTHVAGIAAGFQSNDFAGVAKGADIIAIQIFSKIDDSEFCGGESSTPCLASFSSDQIAALEHVLDLHGQANGISAAAVNMSFGSAETFALACDGDYGSTKAAIDNLLSVGIATVAASGNDEKTGSISAPACISSAIAVGATSKEDELAAFSNHSDLIELLAPGVEISSAKAYADGYVSYSGTSMATPHVAGAFAGLRTLHPDKTVEDLLYVLKHTGKTVDTRDPPRPRIDVYASHQALEGSSLQVVLEPEAARQDGARWSADGGDWLASGEVLEDLIPGQELELSFQYIDDSWLAPPTQTVLLDYGHNELSFEYQAIGAVQVTLGPTGAIDAGAAWRVRGLGTPWRESGYLEGSVPVGSQELEFRAISGWNTPARQGIEVEQGVTGEYQATYSRRTSSGGGVFGLGMLLMLLAWVSLRQRPRMN